MSYSTFRLSRILQQPSTTAATTTTPTPTTGSPAPAPAPAPVPSPSTPTIDSYDPVNYPVSQPLNGKDYNGDGLDDSTGWAVGVKADTGSPSGYSYNGIPVNTDGSVYVAPPPPPTTGGVSAGPTNLQPITPIPSPTPVTGPSPYQSPSSNLDADNNGLNDRTGWAMGVISDSRSPSGYSYNGIPVNTDGSLYTPQPQPQPAPGATPDVFVAEGPQPSYPDADNNGLDDATGFAVGVRADANSPSGYSYNGIPVNTDGSVYTQPAAQPAAPAPGATPDMFVPETQPPSNPDVDNNGLDDRTGWAVGVIADAKSPSGYSYNGIPVNTDGSVYTPPVTQKPGGGVPVSADSAPAVVDADNNGIDDRTGFANGVIADANSPSGYSYNGQPVNKDGSVYVGPQTPPGPEDTPAGPEPWESLSYGAQLQYFFNTPQYADETLTPDLWTASGEQYYTKQADGSFRKVLPTENLEPGIAYYVIPAGSGVYGESRVQEGQGSAIGTMQPGTPSASWFGVSTVDPSAPRPPIQIDPVQGLMNAVTYMGGGPGAAEETARILAQVNAMNNPQIPYEIWLQDALASLSGTGQGGSWTGGGAAAGGGGAPPPPPAGADSGGEVPGPGSAEDIFSIPVGLMTPDQLARLKASFAGGGEVATQPTTTASGWPDQRGAGAETQPTTATGGGAGAGTQPGVGTISYGNDVWNNNPALRFLRGEIDAAAYQTLSNQGSTVPGVGAQLPGPGSQNFTDLVLLAQNPSTFALLKQMYAAANRDLEGEMALARLYSPASNAYESSLIRT